MKTALGVVGGLFLGVAVGWGVASTYGAGGPARSGAGAAASLSAAEGPVLELDGVRYTGADLPTQVRTALYDADHEAFERQSTLLQQFALQLALAKEKNPQVKPTELPSFEELLGVTKPSEEELRQVYDANKSRLPPETTFDQVKGEIERFVLNQKMGETLRAKSAEFRSANRVKLLVQEPLAPKVELNVAGYPAKGPANAPHQLVEASDYLCPHCQQMHAEVEQLVKDLGSKLRFVQVNYSLRPDGLSGTLARGGFCAQQQGDEAFWRYHDAAFKAAKEKGWKSTDSDSADAVLGFAGEAQLDAGKLQACLASQEAKDAVLKAVEAMNAAGISGTPTFWLNGRKAHLHGTPLKDWVQGQMASSH